MSRIANTKRNIVWAYIDYILVTAFSFILRTAVVKYLGAEYLGLSSLFSSILQILNMTELGFSAAIIFNMYNPLAQNDIEAVCALLNFYKRVYLTIAVIILSVGIALSPFLPHLIKGTYPNNINLYGLYFLYLVNTVSSYIFFAYKTALLTALQRLDISKIAYIITSVIQYIAQIIAVIFFRNYYAFVLCLILGTIGKNILTAWLANYYFPKYQCRGTLSPATKNDIILRVKGLLVGLISSVTYTTFDSIILAAFIGLKSVAIYSNYVLIYTGVGSFITIIRTAMEASIGNSVAIETKEKNYNDMLLWQFIFSFIATCCTTCMLLLYQPFMDLWMGKDMLLSEIGVILLCLWFFFSIIQNSYYLYLATTGSWWDMRWPYMVSTIVNLVLNIILGKIWGIAGIIFASLFSSVTSGLLWQCNIIFRIYFQRKPTQFYRRLAVYFTICIVSIFLSSLIISKYVSLFENNILTLIVRAVICTVVSLVIQLLVYSQLPFTKKELKRAISFIMR